MEGEAGEGEGDPGEGCGYEGPGEEEAKDGSDSPGERWVEDEAGFAGVEGGSVGPLREGAMCKLTGGFKPAEEMEVEVVAAGGTVYQHGKYG